LEEKHALLAQHQKELDMVQKNHKKAIIELNAKVLNKNLKYVE